jgi:hypothetical protein
MHEVWRDSSSYSMMGVMASSDAVTTTVKGTMPPPVEAVRYDKGMDERKKTPSPESTPAQPIKAEASTPGELALSRGWANSGGVPSEIPERTEQSVMEGLPPAKAERIAAMRRELAALQRQLTEAQQRIATELQGRADDAERLEALEARLQAQESNAQQEATRATELATEIASLRSQLASVAAMAEGLRREVALRDEKLEEAQHQQRALTGQLEAHGSSLNEAKKLVEARDGEIAMRTAERDVEQATKSRLERELEDQRRQHGEVTSRLESQVASLNEAKTLVATRDAELAAITSERDTLKGAVTAARAKVRDVATQLARFGQDLIDGAGGVAPPSSSEPNPATTARIPERPQPPPPPPPPRAAPGAEPKQVIPILEVTEQSRSNARIALALLGGVIVGGLATGAFMKWNSSSSAMTEDRPHPGAEPPLAALPSEHAPAPEVRIESNEPADASSALLVDSEPQPAPVAEIKTEGVIVLPPDAADHRVFVDGRVVAVKNSRAVVPCGTREIRIGSRGTPRTLNVACGGETAVPADTRDR